MCSWHKKYSHCISCFTVDWKHLSKGYCIKCSPIIKSIGIVIQWDLRQPETLKTIPGFNTNHLRTILQNNRFITAKTEILRQLNNRLTIYRNCFNPEQVDGMSMERLLETFSEIVLKDKGVKMFHGACSKYNSFDNASIMAITKDLNLILANKRFELNLYQILLNKI